MSEFKKSPLYLKYNSGTPMPDFCVPLRDMKALFKSDSSTTGKLIFEKMVALEDFFGIHEKCQLSVGMRNVLVGEFLVPIFESFKKSQAKFQAKSPQTGNVDSLVDSRKKDIEINKLKATHSAIQSKITVLEGELAKEREAIRRYLENGVSLAKTVEAIEKASEVRVAAFKSNYETKNAHARYELGCVSVVLRQNVTKKP
ncbi:hypothetical protein JTE90_001004 [Oedothorax gibbosus]|uniref:Uncharacterized protein n=1 Tax=Oedothorax gibbosus TaxID=931172 RepID=A0AAV6TQN4_9ARAC|nr:hypothetical protein JTE90_001004 [Oedothorax gibbosus]